MLAIKNKRKYIFFEISWFINPRGKATCWSFSKIEEVFKTVVNFCVSTTHDHIYRSYKIKLKIYVKNELLLFTSFGAYQLEVISFFPDEFSINISKNDDRNAEENGFLLRNVTSFIISMTTIKYSESSCLNL